MKRWSAVISTKNIVKLAIIPVLIRKQEKNINAILTPVVLAAPSTDVEAPGLNIKPAVKTVHPLLREESVEVSVVEMVADVVLVVVVK